MQYHYKQHVHLAFCWACTLACTVFLLSLLTGCQLGTTPSPVVNATATAQAAGQPTPRPNKSTPVTSPTPIPVLQTNCPAHGQARAMITTPLTLGTHPALVYSVDASANLIPTSAILRRYDPVTGVKTDIVTLPLVAISHAQLSPDGQ